MKLTFRIHYRTVWGESLKVIVCGYEESPITLHTHDGELWQGEGNLPELSEGTLLKYRYCVYKDEQPIRTEFGNLSHIFYTGNAQQSHCILDDYWRDLPQEACWYSSAFNADATLSAPVVLPDSIGKCITFRAICPRLKEHELAIAGSSEILGKWNPGRALRLQQIAPDVWSTTINAELLDSRCEYKYVLVNKESHQIEQWEERPNRILQIQPLLRGETYITAEEEIYFPQANSKVAGTAIPVFALRSEGSFGVGDFGDLKMLIDWAAQTQQKAIQILPINDTTMTGTWQDSYPYNSISIYAFHPMYIDLRQAGSLKDAELAAQFEAERLELNALAQIDYERVNKAKHAYLHALFEQDGAAVQATQDYQDFFRQNADWLQPYAAFSYLRDLYGTPDFHQWPAHQVFQQEEIQSMCASESASYPTIAYYYYLQYLLHIQLLQAANHARSKGIILKGDIPIGISRTSVEAWVEPYYFNMNGQAGAPPDAFSTKGQNWGFPTYNWDVMAKDNYLWWRKRFHKMAEYFTAYRIDHILGFFRIWEIPDHSVHGLLGQFVPSLPMTVDEIQSFGLTFQKDFMTKPFINEHLLHRVFGEYTTKVRQEFVQHVHHDIYEMRPEFDTQRKVEAWFKGKNDSESNLLREGLYSLISNVLFVPDRNDSDKYHPRICAQNDYIYEVLSPHEKNAFNNLYNHYYYQRHNEFWYHEAMKKLPILTQSTSMLVCGEDLGMVPDCVPWVMNQLQILSLEIQRMPKNPADEFGPVSHYPFRSVCTIGTHDMSTLRGWWEEDAELTSRFYHQVLGHWGDTPEKAPGWICEEVIRQHLNSPSLLCILTFQDWTSMDEELRNPDIEAERINIPANPRHYWRWRMHITIEELMKQTSFNEKVTQLIQESQR